MPESLGELRILPLAEREIALGRSRRSFIPALILLGAMLLIGFHVMLMLGPIAGTLAAKLGLSPIRS